jgi:hypothetical protein
MTCQNLACIGSTGCVESMPGGTPGQVMILNSAGKPSWQAQSTFIDLSTLPNQCLALKPDGLYVPCVDGITGKNQVDQLTSGPYSPAGEVIINSTGFTLNNPDTVRRFYVQIVTSASVFADHTISFTVDFFHRLYYDGTLVASQGDNGEGTHISASPTVPYAVTVMPATSVPVSLTTVIAVQSGVMNRIFVNRITYSWIGFFVEP